MPRRQPDPRPDSLASFVGGFKSAATRAARVTRHAPDLTVWQRSYHEHLVRTARALAYIQRYIAENPAR